MSNIAVYQHYYQEVWDIFGNYVTYAGYLKKLYLSRYVCIQVDMYVDIDFIPPNLHSRNAGQSGICYWYWSGMVLNYQKIYSEMSTWKRVR